MIAYILSFFIHNPIINFSFISVIVNYLNFVTFSKQLLRVIVLYVILP
jgi:hypothetical protein